MSSFFLSTLQDAVELIFSEDVANLGLLSELQDPDSKGNGMHNAYFELVFPDFLMRETIMARRQRLEAMQQQVRMVKGIQRAWHVAARPSSMEDLGRIEGTSPELKEMLVESETLQEIENREEEFLHSRMVTEMEVKRLLDPETGLEGAGLPLLEFHEEVMRFCWEEGAALGFARRFAIFVQLCREQAEVVHNVAPAEHAMDTDVKLCSESTEAPNDATPAERATDTDVKLRFEQAQTVNDVAPVQTTIANGSKLGWNSLKGIPVFSLSLIKDATRDVLPLDNPKKPEEEKNLEHTWWQGSPDGDID